MNNHYALIYKAKTAANREPTIATNDPEIIAAELETVDGVEEALLEPVPVALVLIPVGVE